MTLFLCTGIIKVRVKKYIFTEFLSQILIKDGKFLILSLKKDPASKLNSFKIHLRRPN
jgi:hypothetical protein